MKHSISDLFVFAGLFLISLVVIYSIVFMVYAVPIQHKCIAAGYPDSAVTWDFEGYCERVENGYSVIVPLDEIE